MYSIVLQMKKIDDKHSFLEYRRNQEIKHLSLIENTTNPLHSILTVEMNLTELCNRKCVFCPRHDPKVYPNRNLNTTIEDARTIAKRLADFGYVGRISFSGFGENFLNKQFNEIVQAMRNELPNNVFECNTNGDFLNKKTVTEIYESGMDMLYINLYDGLEQIEPFVEIMKEAGISEDNYKLRAHHTQDEWGLFVNNRSGLIDWIGFDEDDIENLKGTKCHYPYYKMFVDWNGDVLFCSNDWGREIVVGNLIKSSVMDVWMGEEMKKVRDRLSVGDRSHSPCNTCSVKGDLFGEPSFNLINEYYESSNNRSH